MTESQTLAPVVDKPSVFTPPLWLVLALTTVWFSLGAIWKYACDDPFRKLCYTDITPLYVGRGLFDGARMYLDQGAGRYLEYPVLTGAVMQVSGWITGPGGDMHTKTMIFLVVTSILLLLCALGTTAAVWFTRPQLVGATAALMLAVAPILLLESTINWDLIAVLFTALALFAWSRQAALLTGVFIGLGASAKLYPLFLLGPVLIMTLRDRRWRDAERAVAGTVLAWLVANLPVMVLNFDGWKEFYVFSQTRGIDFGSVWFAWQAMGHDFTPTPLANMISTGLFALVCALVAVLAWRYPSATLAQLGFLIIAAFILVNKVYSPQYALWLLPLAVLARPKWPAFLLWQAGEVIYFVAIWRYLLGYGKSETIPGALPEHWYAAAIMVHVVLTIGFGLLILRDIMRAPNTCAVGELEPAHGVSV